jgi:hypothetical protein
VLRYLGSDSLLLEVWSILMLLRCLGIEAPALRDVRASGHDAY